MFTPEAIRAIKTVFFHSGCVDGVAAREIHRACFPNFGGDYVPYSFGTPLLGTELESSLERSLFLDCHPNLDEMEAIISKYDVRVADHHRTFEVFVEGHPDMSDRILFGDEVLSPESLISGCSGARLSYLIGRACANTPMIDWDLLDEFSRIIAIGDTWKIDHPDFDDARKLTNFISLFGNGYQGFHLSSDPLVQAYGASKNARDRSNAKNAIIRTMGAMKIAFLPHRDISDIGEILRNEYGQDMVIGFEIRKIRDEERILYSIRSREGFSARTLAEAIGGGGHETAAGCATDYIPGRDPIVFALDRLSRLNLASMGQP